ncbi:MAG: LysR family transcriptional regulator [Rubrivivax sp.]|jgi:DNA-binding transcriptional LysR family regulator|nr:LysR family transcriptional regulator [Rubrivivax sp.]
MNEPAAVRATFTQLRTFEAVVRLGGVGKAAVALHLAQPTASTQLKELAQAVGLTLFVPHGRGLKLTEEGELLLAHTRELFAGWRRFEEDAAALRGLASGRLRIAAVTTTEYFLPELIGPFARAHPGIDIDLAVENRDAVVRRLERGDDELAVMMLPPQDLPLQRWPFLENPLVIVAPVGHPLARKKRVRLEQLVGEPRLTREAGSGTRAASDEFLAERGVDWPPRMALGSNEAIKHAVIAGLGLAVLSRHTLGTSPERDGLIELPVAGFPIRRRWHLVWQRDRKLSRPARAFLDHLRQRLKSQGKDWEMPTLL